MVPMRIFSVPNGCSTVSPCTHRLRVFIEPFLRGFRVAPTGSKASPNVRYAFNGDAVCASQ